MSLSGGATIEDSRVSNSIIQSAATVRHANVTNSMIGNSASLTGRPNDLSVGDFNALQV